MESWVRLWLTLLEFFILRSVNSKLSGTGVMCRVPAASFCKKSKELAPVTVLGLKRLLSVLAESCRGACTDRESCLPAKLEVMFRVPSKMRSPATEVVRFLTVFPLSFSFRVVNSKLSGIGEMCSVPRLLFEVSSRELAEVMLEGLKRLSMVLEFIWRGRVALRLAEPT